MKAGAHDYIVKDLDAIPGLGPALAKRIVEYRQAHGPFKKIEDLREVSGVGLQNLEKLKPYLGLGNPEDMAPLDWKAAMTTEACIRSSMIRWS